MNKLIRSFGLCFNFSAQQSITPVYETTSGKDKYRRFHKTGPELFLTKILMVDGPLTNKQLWRIYQRKLHEQKVRGVEPDFQYWPSLTKMKQTLKLMRINEKVKTNGYSYKTHQFSGWKIQEKRALEYVHPIVINQIQRQISERQNL